MMVIIPNSQVFNLFLISQQEILKSEVVKNRFSTSKDSQLFTKFNQIAQLEIQNQRELNTKPFDSRNRQIVSSTLKTDSFKLTETKLFLHQITRMVILPRSIHISNSTRRSPRITPNQPLFLIRNYFEIRKKIPFSLELETCQIKTNKSRLLESC